MTEQSWKDWKDHDPDGPKAAARPLLGNMLEFQEAWWRLAVDVSLELPFKRLRRLCLSRWHLASVNKARFDRSFLPPSD